VKIAIGSAFEGGKESAEASIKGRDLVSGLPREVIITESDIREALRSSVNRLTEAVKEVLESTPPEILSDIMNRGIILVGGGALINGLSELLHKETKIPIHIASEPLTSVVRGTGIILEDIEGFREVLIENEDELPPK